MKKEGPGEPPQESGGESYLVEILDGGDVVRSVTVGEAALLYSAADQSADFGAPPASLQLRVAQIGGNGAPGLNKELTIPL